MLMFANHMLLLYRVLGYYIHVHEHCSLNSAAKIVSSIRHTGSVVQLCYFTCHLRNGWSGFSKLLGKEIYSVEYPCGRPFTSART